MRHRFITKFLIFRINFCILNYELLVENPVLLIDRIKSFTNLTLNKFNQETAWQRSQIDFSTTSPDYNIFSLFPGAFSVPLWFLIKEIFHLVILN